MVLGSEEGKKRYEKAKEGIKSTASEYLLSVSAGDYAESAGEELSDFNLRNVTGFTMGRRRSLEDLILGAKAEVMNEARELGAEVVTDIESGISCSLGSKTFYITGTALIPEKEE